VAVERREAHLLQTKRRYNATMDERDYPFMGKALESLAGAER